MKFFLISDNVDTVTGMRLAGIEGVVVHEAQETERVLMKAMDDKDIAVILMTRPSPIISEIPDRHADMDVTASISRYVQEAIGIKL